MGIVRNPDGATKNLACRDMRQFEFFTLSRMSCHLSYIHTRFNNPREITGATFYVLNSRLCFLKSRIVNRCSIIRNKETCETLKNLARCVSVYYPDKLVYMRDFFKLFNPRVLPGVQVS